MIVIFSRDPNLITHANVLGTKYQEKVVLFEPGCFDELKAGERVTFVAHGTKNTIGDESLLPKSFITKLEDYKFPFSEATQFDFPICEIGYVNPDRSSFVRALSEEMERKGYPHQLKSYTTWVTPKKIAYIIISSEASADTYIRGIPQSTVDVYLSELTNLSLKYEEERTALLKFNQALDIFRSATSESKFFENISKANIALYGILDALERTHFPHLASTPFKKLVNSFINAGQKILQSKANPILQKEWITHLKTLLNDPFLQECQRALENSLHRRTDYFNSKYGISLSAIGDTRESLDSNLNFLFSPALHRVINSMDDNHLLVWREINNQIAELRLQKPPPVESSNPIARLERIRKDVEENKLDIRTCIANLIEGSPPLFNPKRVSFFKHLQALELKEGTPTEESKEEAEFPNKNFLILRAAQMGLLSEISKIWSDVSNQSEVAYIAVITNNVSLLYLLSEKKFDFSQPCGEDGLPALCHAVRARNWNMVIQLLELKANPQDFIEAEEAGIAFSLDQVSGFEACMAAQRNYQRLCTVLEANITDHNKLLIGELIYQITQQYRTDPIQFGNKGFKLSSQSLLQQLVSDPNLVSRLTQAGVNLSSLLSFAVKHNQWMEANRLLNAGILPESKPDEPFTLLQQQHLEDLIHSQKLYRGLLSGLNEIKETSIPLLKAIAETKNILEDLYTSHQHDFPHMIETENRLFAHLSAHPMLLNVFQTQGILFELPIYKAIKQKKWHYVEELIENNFPFPTDLSKKLSHTETEKLHEIHKIFKIRNNIFVELNRMELKSDREGLRMELKRQITAQCNEDRFFFATAGFNVASPKIMELLAQEEQFIPALIKGGVDFTLEILENETPIQIAAKLNWGLVIQILSHLPDKNALCDHDKSFLSSNRSVLAAYLDSQKNRPALFKGSVPNIEQLLVWESKISLGLTRSSEG